MTPGTDGIDFPVYGEGVISVRQLEQGSNTSAEHPLDHLMACHQRIEDRLATLERAGAAYTGNPAEAMAAIRRSLAFFATNGVRHTADEEESVFPRMLPLISREESELIATLELQHKEAQSLHDALDRAVAGLESGAPVLDAYRSAVDELARFYRQHIDLEDTTVIAMARRVLSEGQIDAIRDEMRARRGLAPGVSGTKVTG